MSDQDLLDREKAGANGAESDSDYDYEPGRTPTSEELDEQFGDNFSKREKNRFKQLATNDTSPEAAEAGSLGLDDSADAPSKGGKKKNGFFSKKKAAIGAAVASLLFAIVAGLISLTSLKPLAFKNLIDQKLFVTSDQMMTDGTDALTSNYIKNSLIPGMYINGCTTTKVDKSCAAVNESDSPFSQLYHVWRDANIEKNWADQGIEIVRNGRDYSIKVNLPGNHTTTPIPDALGPSNVFDGLGKNEAGKLLRQKGREATHWYQFYFRYQLSALAERKYGTRRCLVACKLKDNLAMKKKDWYQARQGWLVERLITPKSEMAGLFINCLSSDFDCADLAHTSTDSDGRRMTQFERDLQSKLVSLLPRIGETALKDLAQKVEDIKAHGIIYYVVKKLAGETLAKVATTVIPVVGQIDRAAHLITTVKNAGPALKSIVYSMKTAEAVEAYALLSTGADEINSNMTSADAVGEVSGLLDGNPEGDNGTGDASGSRLLQRYNDASTAKSVASVIFPKASAIEELPSENCNNSKPQDATGKCDEYDQTGGTALTTAFEAISADVNATSAIGLPQLAGVWSSVSNAITGFFGDLVGNIIGGALNAVGLGSLAQTLLKHITDVAEPMVKYALGFFVPRCVTDDPNKSSGSRFIDCAIIGAAALNSEASHNEFGGRLLSVAEFLAAKNEVQADQQYAFQHDSIWNRLTSIDQPQSLVSQLAMSTPSTSSGIASFASLGSFFNLSGLVSTFLSRPASAQTVADAPELSIMHIDQFGIPKGDPIYTEIAADPETAWVKYDCANPDVDKTWGDAKVYNEINGQWQAKAPNYCKLMRKLVCVNGVWNAADPEKVCSKKDLYGANSAVAAAPAATSSGTNAIDTFTSTDTMTCPAGTKDVGVATSKYTGDHTTVPAGQLKIRLCQLTSITGRGELPDGSPTTAGAVINALVADRFQKMGEAALASTEKLQLSASSSFRLDDSCNGTGTGGACATPGTSMHQLGVAIDFVGPNVIDTSKQTCAVRVTDTNSPVWVWLSKNASSGFGIKQYSAEAWHWDVLAGDNRCA